MLAITYEEAEFVSEELQSSAPWTLIHLLTVAVFILNNHMVIFCP
jgi:hypothetical protein